MGNIIYNRDDVVHNGNNYNDGGVSVFIAFIVVCGKKSIMFGSVILASLHFMNRKWCQDDAARTPDM